MTRRRTFLARGALPILLVLAVALPSTAGAVVGPKDLEDARQLLVNDVLPVVGVVYDATACQYVGGSIVFYPPGLGQSGLVSCDDPWCHPWLLVSVMCLDLDRFTHPDPEYSGLCVVYQTVTPETVDVPYQSAISPLTLRCLDPLQHNSVYGGWCGFAAQVDCLDDASMRECLVYSTAIGCAQPSSGECQSDLQTFCLGYYYPTDGSQRSRAVCIVWLAPLHQCVTVSDGSTVEE